MIIVIATTPMPIPLFYLVWLLVGEQLATDVIGPRLQGHHVGIHPLEAMPAAMVGFPLAGFVGAFFAVPIVAFIHIVVRTFQGRESDAPDPAAPATVPKTGTEPAIEAS